MTDERDDDLLEPFPIPATDDVWTADDPPERTSEGVEDEEHRGPAPPG